MQRMGALRVRTHGPDDGRRVIAIHGGPAGAGSAYHLARGLAASFRVEEPWQRGSGDRPLTVATHVEDLHRIVESSSEKPALVGESWGAMLALAYSAAHPQSAGPLVLVGCGTFDPGARAQLQATLSERTDDELKRKLDAEPDPARRFALMRRIYVYEPVELEPDPDAPEPFDLRAHEETWSDMLRRQEDGTYPAAFAAIASPVLMLHGDYDPHPGQMIRDGLLPFLPQLEYVELERCGHSPWEERYAREEFFTTMIGWLNVRAGNIGP